MLYYRTIDSELVLDIRILGAGLGYQRFEDAVDDLIVPVLRVAVIVVRCGRERGVAG